MDTVSVGFAAEAVKLWEQMTGTELNSDRPYRIKAQDFSLHSANKSIEQARALGDDTVLTLVIRQQLVQYIEQTTLSVSLADLMRGAVDDFDVTLAPARALKSHLDQEPIKSIHEAFIRDCCEAMAFYRDQSTAPWSQATQEFVERYSALVMLDVVSDLEQLTKLTMFDGVPAEGDSLKVNRLILAFQTLQELREHGASIPSGFSMCAITSDHISDSYFVLVVRNGGRVIIVTDKGIYTHPLQQERMRSRNDRYNLVRIENSRFPYDLLDIRWSDSGRRSHAGTHGHSLTTSDAGYRVLGTLDDLDDSDLLWFHLLVDRCRARYFDHNVTEPAMATGAMIQITHPWSGESNLPVTIGETLDIDFKTSQDLSTEFMHSIEPNWRNRTNTNLWMEERFSHLVPDYALYIPGNADTVDTHIPLLVSDSDSGRAAVELVDDTPRHWRENRLNLKRIEPQSLASKERVTRDAHFLARHNQAAVIHALVVQDYHQREDDMRRWFHRAAADNLPNIIDDLLALHHQRFSVSPEAHDELTGGHTKSAFISSSPGSRQRAVRITYDPKAMQRLFSRSEDQRVSKLKHALDLVDYDSMTDLCYLDGETPAQLALSLDVKNIHDLMMITGLPRDQIPVELHAMGIDVYVGNSILDRIDPLAVLPNPWNNLKFTFSLPVSLKNFKAWRKARSLPTPRASLLEEWARDQANQAWIELRESEGQSRPSAPGLKRSN